MQIYFLILYFYTYGFLGWCTEVAYATTKERRFVNRGFLNGPICPIYGVGVSVVIYFLTPVSANLLFLYLASTVLVTVLEGLTGYLMDKIFHHKWWDYSKQPLNIGGYVCLIFSLIWGVACVAIVKVIHPVIHKVLAFLPVTAGIVLIVFLSAVLFADLYVTASGILKFNRQLEMMEKIAQELKEISDKLGETIHENVMETMETFNEEEIRKLGERTMQQRERIEEHLEEQRGKIEGHLEEQRGKIEGYLEEQRGRMQELRERYEELILQRPKVAGRLINAFPKMEPRHHKEAFEELKMKIKNRGRL